MSEFPYYYGTEPEQFSFYQLPKSLMNDERYSQISVEAKFLYCILRDRMSLSRANKWLDDENRVYIIFPVKEVAEKLGCSERKASSLLAELDTKRGAGLIEKKQRGLGLSNIIYVKNFMVDDEPKKDNKEQKACENKGRSARFSDQKERAGQELQECAGLELQERAGQELQERAGQELQERAGQELQERAGQELQECSGQELHEKVGLKNNTKYNNTKYKINQSISDKDARSAMLDIFKGNISYSAFVHDEQVFNYDIGMIDEILTNMVETYCTKNSTLLVNGEKMSVEIVRNQLMKVNEEHIKYMLETLRKTKGRINNVKAYILTCLYNAPNTINTYYQMELQADTWDGR